MTEFQTTGIFFILGSYLDIGIQSMNTGHYTSMAVIAGTYQLKLHFLRI